MPNAHFIAKVPPDIPIKAGPIVAAISGVHCISTATVYPMSFFMSINCIIQYCPSVQFIFEPIYIELPIAKVTFYPLMIEVGSSVRSE